MTVVGLVLVVGLAFGTTAPTVAATHDVCHGILAMEDCGDVRGLAAEPLECHGDCDGGDVPGPEDIPDVPGPREILENSGFNCKTKVDYGTTKPGPVAVTVPETMTKAGVEICLDPWGDDCLVTATARVYNGAESGLALTHPVTLDPLVWRDDSEESFLWSPALPYRNVDADAAPLISDGTSVTTYASIATEAPGSTKDIETASAQLTRTC